jgi:hypothetical protein
MATGWRWISGKGRFEVIPPSGYKLKENPSQVETILDKAKPGAYAFRISAYNFSGPGPSSTVEKVVVPGAIQEQVVHEPPLPIETDTLLIDFGKIYDWGIAGGKIKELEHDKRLKVARYVLQERDQSDQFRTRSEYEDLQRPVLEIGKKYRYALYNEQGSLLAVVTFFIERDFRQRSL